MEIDVKCDIPKGKYGSDINSVTKYEALYIICNLYKLDGILNQGIVIVYRGMRPANEAGFIYKFEEYDYSVGIRKKLHAHKCDKNVISRLVEEMLNIIVNLNNNIIFIEFYTAIFE